MFIRSLEKTTIEMEWFTIFIFYNSEVFKQWLNAKAIDAKPNRFSRKNGVYV